MTRETREAGRELDAEVAEKVMGWRVERWLVKRPSGSAEKLVTALKVLAETAEAPPHPADTRGPGEQVVLYSWLRAVAVRFREAATALTTLREENKELAEQADALDVLYTNWRARAEASEAENERLKATVRDEAGARDRALAALAASEARVRALEEGLREAGLHADEALAESDGSDLFAHDALGVVSNIARALLATPEETKR